MGDCTVGTSPAVSDLRKAQHGATSWEFGQGVDRSAQGWRGGQQNSHILSVVNLKLYG